jgi:hypothetical protein
MTSGSSSRVISSGTVVMASGGAIVPVIVCGPTFAFPFSNLVGGLTTGYVASGPIYTLIGSCKEDWAVSSAIWPDLGLVSRSFKLMTTGGRDG